MKLAYLKLIQACMGGVLLVIRYSLLWVRGSQIEQSYELPIRQIRAMQNYAFSSPLYLAGLGQDLLLGYDGTLGHIANKNYVWKKRDGSSALALNLQAKYVDEQKYTISGSAQLDGQTFSLQGQRYARINSKIVAQTSPLPPPFLQFRINLLSNNGVKWSLAGQIEPYSTTGLYVVGAAPGDKTIELDTYGFNTYYLLEQPFVASLERQP